MIIKIQEMRTFVKLFILPCLLFCTAQLRATHIVGGELTYTCLGNDKYEVQLTIFRDCFNGSPNAWFDDPASIGVFSAVTNQLEFEIQIPLDQMLNDTLNPTLVGECLTVPPNVCVHTTTYTTEVDIPFLEGGYILAYQRCCRNQTINNIVLPLETGATYSVEITEQALNECNSSPKFNSWPPLYICAGFPIFYDQSTTDIDGDSVVYSLCDPFEGADQDDPQPQPPNNPPYLPVTWEAGFGVEDMLNGQNGAITPLEIDPETGILTGTPTITGQFVVGICVEEYRDGVLIGTTRRDFQYNVGDCGQPGAAFFAPELQCDDLIVSFDNLSTNADEYLWTFDLENNPEITSVAANPQFIYPSFGTYTVMLVVNPETACVDTAFQDISLIPNPLSPGFTFEFEECTNELVIQFNDTSTDSESEITDWFWEFNLDGEIQNSNQQNPEFVADEDGLAQITLTVNSGTGCSAQFTEFIPIDILEEEVQADTLVICPGESVNLHPDFNAGYNYSWQPADFLDNPLSGNPLANPNETTTYSVSVTNPSNGCTSAEEVTVLVPEEVSLELGEDYTTCDTDVLLEAETNTGIDFFWATDADINDLISQEETVIVTPFGETTYYLFVRDEFGCPAIDSLTVVGNGINHTADDVTLLCPGDTTTLIAQNTDPNDNLSFSWTPLDNIISGANTATPIVSFEEAGSSFFYLEMSNQFDCTLTDTLTLAVIDSTNQASFVSSQQCSGTSVQFFNESINAPYYLWNFGDPSTTNDFSTEANPVYTYPEAGTYFVTLSLPPSVDCAESITIPVEVGEPDIQVDFTWIVSDCGEELTLVFTDESSNNQSLITDRLWTFSNGVSLEGESVELSISESQILNAQLVILSEDGCSDTLSQDVPLTLPESFLQDTVVACPGTTVGLNPMGNTDYSYSWSPEDYLSDSQVANPAASPPVTTVYSVTISDNSQGYLCEIVQEVTAFVPPPIDFMIEGETESCGEPLELYATGQDELAWSSSPDFSDIFAQTDTVSVNSEREDIFYARTFDEFGCALIDSIITHDYTPEILLEPEQIVCINDTLLLQAESIFPEDELTYLWYPTEEIISQNSDGSVLVSPTQSTTYSLTVTNQFACEAEAEATLSVVNLFPGFQLSAQDDTLFIGQSTQLNATNLPGVIYSWSPQESLNQSNIPDPVASPTETTTYTLELLSPDGCSDERSITITVVDIECRNPFIYFPNTFSPDGDGSNETFGALGPFIEESYLVVFNRWGEKVFESNEVGGAWDGTRNGFPLSPDVYAYYCRVACIGGESKEFKGNVTLLR